MKLLIETCLEKMFISLVNSKGITIGFYLKKEKHKSDLLNFEVVKLMKENNVALNDIKGIYVTQGPGSFMGARAGLIYAKTIVQIKKNIKLYLASTFVYVANQKNGIYYLNASGQMVYKCVIKDAKYITTVIEGVDVSPIDYEAIINNPVFTESFINIKNIINVQPNYIKEPTIGGK